MKIMQFLIYLGNVLGEISIKYNKIKNLVPVFLDKNLDRSEHIQIEWRAVAYPVSGGLVASTQI